MRSEQNADRHPDGAGLRAGDLKASERRLKCSRCGGKEAWMTILPPLGVVKDHQADQKFELSPNACFGSKPDIRR